MKSLLLSLLVITTINGFSQSQKDSVVYDTIPARFQIYEDKCDRCPIVIEFGYVVYQNIVIYEKIKLSNPNYSKDSATTIVWYLGQPVQADVNPYLRKNKLPMWGNYTVWDYKLDRKCTLTPLKGL